MKMTESTFSAVFRELYPHLANYASMLVKEYEVDDVVQEAFVELWHHLDQIDDQQHLKSYLYKSVHSRALNIIKHRGIADSYAASEKNIALQRLEYYSPDLNDIDRMMDNADLKKQLEQAIDELPPKMRQVFIMSYLHDMKTKDIANIMGTSTRTVEGQIYKSLKLLREKLGKVVTAFAIFLLLST